MFEPFLAVRDRLKNLMSSANIDFVGWRRVFAVISIVAVTLSWVAFFLVGPNWGIDFTGGTEMHLKFCTEEIGGKELDDGRTLPNCDEVPLEDRIAVGEIREVLVALKVSEDAVQAVGSERDEEYIIRIQEATFGADELIEQVKMALVDEFGEGWSTFEREPEAEVGVRMVVDYTGKPVVAADVADVLKDVDGVRVYDGKADNQLIIQLPPLGSQIEKLIGDAMGGRPFEVLESTSVGPKVGEDLKWDAFAAIGLTLGLVLVYIAFRFDITFAPGAILALFHDVSLVTFAFVIFQREVNLAFIGALLTTVGYSLNDTIVIYDRIRENKDRYRRKELPDLINVSVNETLARTLATSVTTALALTFFLVFADGVIWDFALAMILGVAFGTYSTVYVASPTVLVMQDIRPHLTKLIAIPGLQRATEEDAEAAPDTVPDADLTQSERRRRERARARGDGSA